MTKVNIYAIALVAGDDAFILYYKTRQNALNRLYEQEYTNIDEVYEIETYIGSNIYNNTSD